VARAIEEKFLSRPQSDLELQARRLDQGGRPSSAWYGECEAPGRPFGMLSPHLRFAANAQAK
jgi:hypothetical protein